MLISIKTNNLTQSNIGLYGVFVSKCGFLYTINEIDNQTYLI